MFDRLKKFFPQKQALVNRYQSEFEEKLNSNDPQRYEGIDVPENDIEVLIPEKSRIAYKHSNPGNMIYAGQPGAVKGEQRDDGTYWADFKGNAKAGLNALGNQVNKDKERNLTVSGFVSKYAPASDNNNTQRYIQDVSSELGVNPEEPIKNIQTEALTRIMAKLDSGTQVKKKDNRGGLSKREYAKKND